MQSSKGDVCALVVVSGGRWQSTYLDSDTAVSLIATLSEDPANWDEVMAYWPRYRTPVVIQDLGQLQFVSDGAERQHGEHLREDSDWLSIDFDVKRVVTSKSLSIAGPDCVLDLFSDDNPGQRWPLSIHLPPWWELINAATASEVRRPRRTPLHVPHTNRQFLFGSALIEYLAQRILANGSEKVLAVIKKEDKRDLHALSVDIHRAWLMTPCIELGGLTPRQLLHGAHGWISRVTEGQSIRAQEALPLIAGPTDVGGYATAAMGREEVIVYFDLCRYLIESGWQWLRENWGAQNRSRPGAVRPGAVRPGAVRPEQEPIQVIPQTLIDYLEAEKVKFLTSPLEGGSTPGFIVECSRRRVPRSPDFTIEGIQEQEPRTHVLDCQCPICLVMAEADFGPSFAALDGYHLELDEEFAFSLFETYQQWQEESWFLSDDESLADDDDDDDDDDDELEEMQHVHLQRKPHKDC